MDSGQNPNTDRIAGVPPDYLEVCSIPVQGILNQIILLEDAPLVFYNESG